MITLYNIMHLLQLHIIIISIITFITIFLNYIILYLLVWFTISYMFYIYSFLCFPWKKVHLGNSIVLPISFTMVSIYLGLGLWALADLLGSIGGIGFGFGSGALEAETVGVALLWPTLGFWATLFVSLPHFHFSFPLFALLLAQTLGFFPPSFHFPLYFHSHFLLMELSLH